LNNNSVVLSLTKKPLKSTIGLAAFNKATLKKKFPHVILIKKKKRKREGGVICDEVTG